MTGASLDRASIETDFGGSSVEVGQWQLLESSPL